MNGILQPKKIVYSPGQINLALLTDCVTECGWKWFLGLKLICPPFSDNCLYTTGHRCINGACLDSQVWYDIIQVSIELKQLKIFSASLQKQILSLSPSLSSCHVMIMNSWLRASPLSPWKLFECHFIEFDNDHNDRHHRHHRIHCHHCIMMNDIFSVPLQWRLGRKRV